ncbi:hypothetical protein OnM2_063057, partial [Erysiphe neolycopersici]
PLHFLALPTSSLVNSPDFIILVEEVSYFFTVENLQGMMWEAKENEEAASKS